MLIFWRVNPHQLGAEMAAQLLPESKMLIEKAGSGKQQLLTGKPGALRVELKESAQRAGVFGPLLQLLAFLILQVGEPVGESQEDVGGGRGRDYQLGQRSVLSQAAFHMRPKNLVKPRQHLKS